MTEKLIRDLIPALAADDGQCLTVRAASVDEMSGLLRRKLIEESAEAAAASSELLEELADVLEVVRALAAVHGFDAADVERARVAKASARGGFERGLVWEDVPAAVSVPAADRGGDGSSSSLESAAANSRQPASDLNTADRAAVLTGVADRYQGFLDNADTSADPRYWTGIRDMVIGLRHIAVESAAVDRVAETTPVGTSTPAANGTGAPVAASDLAAEDLAKHVARAIFALKRPAPPGSEHYRSGWDDGLEAAMDAARDAVLRLTAAPVVGVTADTTPAETVHACPPDGSGITPCCGRTPFELPRTDRISSEEGTVTCRQRCAHCGKPVRQVTGTLAAWWVHDPDGHAACHPEHAAASTRAEPSEDGARS